MEMTMVASQIIGCGAAGGKVVAQLIADEVMNEDHCLIINSTDQDRPDCECKFINIGSIDDLGGCAKEPKRGEELCTEALRGNLANELSTFIKADTRKVYVVASLEGGTGCGSSILIAKFINMVVGLPVHIIGIAGFEDDARGLKNMIQFFQRLDPDTFTVTVLSNKKFLREASGNKLRAEEMCNQEISAIISVLNGQTIIPSTKNIDANDLFKLSTKKGFTNVCYMELNDKIRNKEQFNQILKQMVDESKSIDVDEPKQTVMGVIINLPEDEQINIDYNFIPVFEAYNTGESVCYEVFVHIQYDDTAINSIAFINTGIQLPTQEVQRMYTEYTELEKRSKEEAKKKRQQFKDEMNRIVFDSDNENDLESSSSKLSADEFLAALTNNTKKSYDKKKDITDNY